jgi:hypothetical protein
VRERFEQIRTLVINLDNGPENQSHRTQFLNRMVAFAQTSHLPRDTQRDNLKK